MSRPASKAAPSVPVVLVRLKVRLMVNRAKSARAVGLILGAVAAVIAGLLGFVGAAASASAHDPRASRAVLVIGAGVLFIGWTVLPLVAFGTDETLDPGRLVLLPLRRGPLMRGLLLASLVGFAPAAVAMTLAGVVAGYGRGFGVAVVLVAVILLFLLCAAMARMTATALVARLTSRRGRDAMVIVASLLGLALQGVRFLRLGTVDPALLDRISGVVRWTPPGMLGQAVIDAGRRRLLLAGAELVPALVLIPFLLILWGGALDHALTVVVGDGAVKHGSERKSVLPLLPRRLPFIAASPWGAVAAKELRYVSRDPRRKVLLLNSVVLGAGLPLYLGITTGASLSPLAVLLASLAGYVTILSSMNQFGLDGGALWLDVVAGQVVRAELIGKNVATVVMVVPGVLVAAVVLAAFSGGWVFVPAAVALGIAGVGVGLAVANVTSVRLPQRLPETRNPFGRSGSGAGCVTALAMLLATAIQGLLLSPIVIAAAIATVVSPWLLAVVAPAAVGYGFLLWRAGLRVAGDWAWWRQPELLGAVDPRRS